MDCCIFVQIFKLPYSNLNNSTPSCTEHTTNITLSHACGSLEWDTRLIWDQQPSHDSSAVDLRAADLSLEEDDVLLVEVLCVDLVGWRHAVAVAEAMNVDLDIRTEALRLQMGLELEGAGALRVGRDGGRLHAGLRMGLCRGHGGFLNTWRVGGADGGGGLGVWPSVVWRTELICQRHKRRDIREQGITPKIAQKLPAD